VKVHVVMGVYSHVFVILLIMYVSITHVKDPVVMVQVVLAALARIYVDV
jgi:hypothetical protein